MKKRHKALTIIGLGLVFFWLVAGTVDYYRVYHLFERPIFSFSGDTADDGGSGTYRGLGYAFAIEGNFMPDTEFPGVTRYEYYLFGDLAQSGVRD